MIKVRGYATEEAKSPLKPFSFERRTPGENDVLIEIQYCGICHTDISLSRNEWGSSRYPMVPGHEITGVVTQVGSKVTKFKTGDKVGVGCFTDSCRHCAECEAGMESYCVKGPQSTYNGLAKDGVSLNFGGYSSHIVVDENYVLKMPSNLSMSAAAPLLCAGITTYSPLKNWNAGPGKKVAFIGLGGLGHVGIKIARAMGAEVTVLSHSLKKQEDSKRLGAQHFYDTSDAKSLEKLKRSFDLIINTVSAPMDWNMYLQLLKIDGNMVLLGIPNQPVPLMAFPLIMGRRSLAGSLVGGIKETQEMLDFCGKHNIECDIEKISIQNVNEAYERVLKSDVRYRFVIDMKSLEQNV